MTGTQSGNSLPLALALLSMLSLLAIHAIKTAALEFGLTKSVSDAEQVFQLASHGINRALHQANLYPENLPTNDTDAPWLASDWAMADIGKHHAEISFAGLDTYCPQLAPEPAERLNYEIRSTATKATATNIQLQGFYICRSECVSPPCLATELAPTKSYWTVLPSNP
jgi:hypothetical protein